MASKSKKPAATTKSETTIRVKASAAGTSKKSAQVLKDEPNNENKKTKKEKKQRKNPFKATGGYFAGAWSELKQVRWPTRRATWSMTAAMIGFTAFFVVVILLLDALFKYVFQLILG